MMASNIEDPFQHRMHAILGQKADNDVARHFRK